MRPGHAHHAGAAAGRDDTGTGAGTRTCTGARAGTRAGRGPGPRRGARARAGTCPRTRAGSRADARRPRGCARSGGRGRGDARADAVGQGRDGRVPDAGCDRPSRSRPRPRQTLPFTGADAGVIALLGAASLAGGLALRAGRRCATLDDMTAHVGRSMRAMVFEGAGRPLRLVEREPPAAGAGPAAAARRACGVCRTDLHLLDGEVDDPDPPRVLGHQIVGTRRAGRPARRRAVARLDLRRVRVLPLRAREPLRRARFTGRDIDGGFAEYAVADERFCFPIPDGFADEQAAPLLCAGLIGYRALRLCGDARRLGLYGFGAAAHILVQVARWQGREVFAFTRPGDEAGAAFARELGAAWAGASAAAPPAPLDAAIIFAPDGALVPLALRAVAPGGTSSAAAST